MSKPSNEKMWRHAVAAVAVITVMLAPDLAQAGTGGSEFDDIWTTLTDWTQGTLGRIVAGAFIVVGMIAGVARQSLMAGATGVGGGMVMANAPTIVDNVVSATVAAGMHIPDEITVASLMVLHH